MSRGELYNSGGPFATMCAAWRIKAWHCRTLDVAQTNPALPWPRTKQTTSNLVTGSPYKSCGPICLNKACSWTFVCYLLSDRERSLLFRHIRQSSPPLLTRLYSTIARPTRDNRQTWVWASFIQTNRSTTLVWAPCYLVCTRSLALFFTCFPVRIGSQNDVSWTQYY